MVQRIVWRVSSEKALEFWKERLGAHGIDAELSQGRLLFADPEGLGHELLATATDDEPLTATLPEIPREHALQGFDGVRAYSLDPSRSERLLGETLGFTEGRGWALGGARRAAGRLLRLRPRSGGQPRAGGRHGAPRGVRGAARGRGGVARRLAEAGARPTPVIDRFYFRSIYFREPSGVLMEIATIGPGFAVDEDAAHLGERLSLPPRFESLRARLEDSLTPLPDRSSATRIAG